MVSRRVPADVRRQLTLEVGYHCPADVGGDICGSPYLTWHHFDPPWRVEHHHRPDGMIALCREHADKADHGSFTDDQLRILKTEGHGRGREISGRFDWMRRELLPVVGGNAYPRTSRLIQIAGRDSVWFSRNSQSEMLLNFDIPSLTTDIRVSIRENGWVINPFGVSEVICPPNGKHLRVAYPNGDLFEARYSEVASLAELLKLYEFIPMLRSTNFEFPLTTVEITQVAARSSLQLMPRETLVGTNTITGGVFDGNNANGVGIGISEIHRVGMPDGPSVGLDSISRLLHEARNLPGYRQG